MAVAEQLPQILVVILCIIIGTLAAIVYSLRVLVLMERRVERIESHIEKLTAGVLREEVKLERSMKKRR
jgi:hypothetical protein